MKEQRKLWVGLGAALIATSGASSFAADSDLHNSHSSQSALKMAALSGEGEGGEGEGEGGGNVDLRTDDAAYLGQLGLVRGHLWVGIQLYKNGHLDMAKTHMKHPGDELYAGIEPAMQARGHAGFASELSALSSSVEAEKPVETVEQRHAELEEAIARLEAATQPDLATVLFSIERMVRVAAEEYAIGVTEGEITNAHEYQDALGFTQIARQRLAGLTDEQRAQGPEAITEVQEQLTLIENLWPELVPDSRLEGTASELYGAAARIQLAASELD